MEDLKVIVKSMELAEHTLRITSNCNRYPKKYRFSLVDKMQEEKFYEKYNAWRNHAMHGNCIKLCNTMDLYCKKILESE